MARIIFLSTIFMLQICPCFAMNKHILNLPDQDTLTQKFLVDLYRAYEGENYTGFDLRELCAQHQTLISTEKSLQTKINVYEFSRLSNIADINKFNQRVLLPFDIEDHFSAEYKQTILSLLNKNSERWNRVIKRKYTAMADINSTVNKIFSCFLLLGTCRYNLLLADPTEHFVKTPFIFILLSSILYSVSCRKDFLIKKLQEGVEENKKKVENTKNLALIVTRLSHVPYTDFLIYNLSGWKADVNFKFSRK